ncbi:MAG: hypothetical protein M1821_000346 [Bathelium mastoideum]|nr:MAG: hypothetical protein M1821_000346 [Bathelium mastoideum]
MSLNGLDSPKIAAAYQSALSEAGGWFLLKYASRDEVELHAQGHGGVAELRSAAAQYAQKSPLYGFLLYRRRKVLLKYIPEGTSRLLQARVAVHFQAVVERLSPFDTILNSSSPETLNDGALAAAFPLHTASPSNSSNRLHEISEDGEEGQSQAKRVESPSMETVSEAPTVESTNEPESPRHFDAPTITISDEKTSVLLEPNTVGSKIIVSEEELSKPDMSKPDTELNSASPPHSPTKTSEFTDRPEDLPRLSSQSARLSSSDLLYSSLYDIKPKVKLGPRPSLDMKRRPNTSGAHGGLGNRSVATLPAGLKMFPKKTEHSKKAESSTRPKSLAEEPKTAGLIVPPLPPVPDVLNITIPSPRPSSRGSTKSMPSSMTPEKRRLMKALELRKKQMAAARSTPTKPQPQHDRTESITAKNIKDEEEVDSRGQSGGSSIGVKVDSGLGIQYEKKPQMNNSTKTTFSEEESKEELDEPMPSDSTRDDGAAVALQNSNHQEASIEENSVNHPASKPSRNSIVNEDELQSGSEITTRPDAVHQDERRVNGDEGLSMPANDSPQIEEPAAALQNDEKDVSAINLRQKRRGIVEPIQIHISADPSEPDYLSDDSFMEELQSAKVEEARSLSVSKSPATPIFSRRPSSTSANSGTTGPASRIGLEKMERQKDHSPATISRLSSQEQDPATYSNQKSQEAANVSRQRTVSSGISKRIQALAEHSIRTSPTIATFPAMNSDSNPSFLALRRPSLQNKSRTSIVSSPRLQRGLSKGKDSRPKSPEEGQTTYKVHRKHGQSESISVTARIIRDPQMQSSEFSEQSESGSLELYQSPLIINHQRAENTVSGSPPTSSGSMRPPVQKQNANRSNAIPALTSEASSRDTPSGIAPHASESSWRNSAQARQSSDLKSPPPTARSQSNSSLASDDRAQDGSTDANTSKKKSRTSRLFKRMSNTMNSANSHRRRSLVAIMSPTASAKLEEGRSPVREAPEPLVEEQMLASGKAWMPVEVGDLNVQFPDTLLWKRRWVQIDAKGYLILGLSKANEHQRGVTKTYHLSEFKQQPFAPDQDRQELPNSVILDFRDGSSLQCACEDYYGQVQVLKLLQDAYKAWNS